MRYICKTNEGNLIKLKTMKANVKISEGTRVKVISGGDAGHIGTVQFNKGQCWYIALDGETRPANIVGRQFYYTEQYKKNIELI